MVNRLPLIRAVAGLLLGLLAAHDAVAQSTSVYLERNPIRADETVRLVVEVHDDVSERALDLSTLTADFVVHGTSNSKNVNIINGQRSTVTRWWVELEPRREGMLEIPALTVGAVSTEPVTLEVLPADATVAAPRDVALVARFEPVNAYVDGQLTYVIRLELGVSISSGSLSEPDIPGAVVERLGEDASFEVRRAGRRWRVIERRYAVFPESPGELVVGPVQFSARVSAGFSNDLFGGNSRILRARSDEVRIEVRGQPPHFSGATWLPAADLRVEESFSADPATFRVGEPLTRTIGIEALGLRGEQLPPVESSPPAGLRTYPDQPQLRTGRDGDRVVGVREQRVAIVPSQPGELILPSVRIPWWDVVQDIERVAEIPARRIDVLPALSTGVATELPAAPSAGAEPTSVPESQPRFPWRDKAGIGFALLWLVTLIAWWRARRARPPGAVDRPTPDPQLPARRADLKRACRDGDAQAAKRAMAAWAARRWPDEAPGSLSQLAQRLDDEALSAALRDLDRALYSRVPGTWDGASLWGAFDSLAARRPGRRGAGQRDPLAALYPGEAGAGP